MSSPLSTTADDASGSQHPRDNHASDNKDAHNRLPDPVATVRHCSVVNMSDVAGLALGDAHGRACDTLMQALG